MKPRANRERQAAYRRGGRSELLAVLFLQLTGWRILDRNFRCRNGEIDIVARRGSVIAFVEVKARGTLEAALEAVGARSKRRIAAAAGVWIGWHPEAGHLAWRFDIIAIRPWRLPVHVADAFANPIA